MKGRTTGWNFSLVQIAPGPPYECMYTWGGSSNMSLKNIKVFFFPTCVLLLERIKTTAYSISNPRTVPSGREYKQSR